MHREVNSACAGYTCDWVLQKFGEQEGMEIVSTAITLMKQTIALEREIDWRRTDLREAQIYMEQRLQEEDPRLTQAAANGIARHFRYQVQ